MAQKQNKSPAINQYYRGFMIHSYHFRNHPEQFWGRGIRAISPLYATRTFGGPVKKIVTVNLKSGSSTDKNISKFQRVWGRRRHLANATCLIQFADLV